MLNAFPEVCSAKAVHVDKFGEGDKITMVIAALTVYVK